MKLPAKLRPDIKSNLKSSELKRPGFYVHKLLNFALPIVIFLLVQYDLPQLAILVALMSKWRVFAVKPRHIITNLRSNLIDIAVKVSTIALMFDAETVPVQLLWTAWYIVWLVVIKPGSSKSLVALQAAAGQLLGLVAILLYSGDLNQIVMLALIWIVSLASARHMLSSYEEPKARLMAHIWAMFVLNLSWVLSKWLIVYVIVPQMVFIVLLIGYVIRSIYETYQQDGEIKPSFLRQQLGMTIVVLAIIIVLGDWQGSI